MSASLAERIWNAVPVTQPAFVHLLDLLEIAESREVATAAVTLGARSRLLINPDFAAQHCTTNARLVTLVMHELFHVLLGHTRLFTRVTAAQNFAFDAVINAHLCLLFPSPKQTALFRALYKADRFPEALLRPPQGWRTSAERWQLTGDAKRVHRALYSETSVTYTELFALLQPLMGQGCEGAVGTEQLLGSHGEIEGEAMSADADFAQAIRGILAEWPMHEQISGRDQGGELHDEHVKSTRARAAFVAVLRRALFAVLDIGVGSSGPYRAVQAPVETVLSYRTCGDRRGAVRAAVGLPVLLHRAELAAPTLARAERVHVYLDVSGSMTLLIPRIYAALRPFLGLLHERVHLFSTEVCDVAPQALIQGRVWGTGGTAIDCVTEHLLQERITRALIITDGWVGKVPPSDLRRIKSRRVRFSAAITDPGQTTFADVLAARTFRLPPLHDG